MTESVLLKRGEGRITRFKLNRPAVGNAIDQSLAVAFAHEAELLASESAPRIVLVESGGPVFCAGGDLAAVAAADDPAAYLDRLGRTMHAGLIALRESPHIIVACVQGAAAGAGLGLVLNADLVVASSNAVFLSAYAEVGLTPDCGVTRLLPEVVGVRRATELLVTGRMLSAQEALEWGLINAVAEPEELDERVAALLNRLSAGAALTQVRTVALMRDRRPTFEDHLEAELTAIVAQMALGEASERMAAFLL